MFLLILKHGHFFCCFCQLYAPLGKAFGLNHKVVCEANHCWQQEEAKPSLGIKCAVKKTDHCRDRAWHTSEGKGRLLWASRPPVPPYYLILCNIWKKGGKEVRENVAVKLIYPLIIRIYCFGSLSSPAKSHMVGWLLI